MPTTPDNKREHCIHTDEGVCDTCKSDREIEDNNFLEKTLAEFDLLWGLAPKDSLKGKKGKVIREFIASALNAQKEKAREEHYEEFSETCKQLETDIYARAHEEIREKIKKIRTDYKNEPNSFIDGMEAMRSDVFKLLSSNKKDL